MTDDGGYLPSTLMQCTKCGIQYPIVPFFPAVMSHGPNRECDGREWVRVEDKKTGAA